MVGARYLEKVDAYCKIGFNKVIKDIRKTERVTSTEPVWNKAEEIKLEIAEKDMDDFNLVVTVMKHNILPDSIIGDCTIELSFILIKKFIYFIFNVW